MDQIDGEIQQLWKDFNIRMNVKFKLFGERLDKKLSFWAKPLNYVENKQRQMPTTRERYRNDKSLKSTEQSTPCFERKEEQSFFDDLDDTEQMNDRMKVKHRKWKVESEDYRKWKTESEEQNNHAQHMKIQELHQQSSKVFNHNREFEFDQAWEEYSIINTSN